MDEQIELCCYWMLVHELTRAMQEDRDGPGAPDTGTRDLSAGAGQMTLGHLVGEISLERLSRANNPDNIS
ncbi:hypothetical protein KQX54_003430 [Cotesia glomerata]|uniref:Uncharacterized protein n=1 Tax=Cotesia glomerata TaxID=32391 RepID=A0AAV7HVK7_COTGL|nr:hypothetical protein KQX54_003430 [Cotesia glomerata]